MHELCGWYNLKGKCVSSMSATALPSREFAECERSNISGVTNTASQNSLRITQQTRSRIHAVMGRCVVVKGCVGPVALSYRGDDVIGKQGLSGYANAEKDKLSDTPRSGDFKARTSIQHLMRQTLFQTQH